MLSDIINESILSSVRETMRLWSNLSTAERDPMRGKQRQQDGYNINSSYSESYEFKWSQNVVKRKENDLITSPSRTETLSKQITKQRLRFARTQSFCKRIYNLAPHDLYVVIAYLKYLTSNASRNTTRPRQPRTKDAEDTKTQAAEQNKLDGKEIVNCKYPWLYGSSLV